MTSPRRVKLKNENHAENLEKLLTRDKNSEKSTPEAACCTAIFGVF